MPTPSVGDPAPPILGTDVLSGNTFDLGENLGKVVLVVFSGPSWCGPCQFENPHLAELWAGKFEACSDTRFVLCAWGESSNSKLVNAVTIQGITFPVLNDPEITNVWDIHSVPHIFIVGKDGKVSAIKDGAGGSGEALIAEIGKMLTDCGACTEKGLETGDALARRWTQAVRIIFGIAGDGGGLGVTPGGKPVPVGPWDPLRPSAAGTDALVALATFELARSMARVSDRTVVQEHAVSALELATKQMRAQAQAGSYRGPDKMSELKGK